MRTRFTIVRLALGALLLAAAGLKLYGLSVSAVPQVGWFAQPWVQLAAAEWELILVLWLLSGSHQRGAWLAALVTFVAFAGVSGYLGFVGVASCGCFGTIQASPWWAFAVDVVALAVLVWFAPPRIVVPSSDRSSVASVLLGTAAMLVVVTLVGSWVYGSPDAALAKLRGESLAVTPGQVDFGSGQPGELLEGVATVRNWTSHPVRVIGGTSNCSCTALGDLPVVIDPRGTAKITVQLRVPAATHGHFTKTVYLRTDCADQQLVVFTIGCRVE